MLSCWRLRPEVRVLAARERGRFPGFGRPARRAAVSLLLDSRAVRESVSLVNPTHHSPPLSPLPRVAASNHSWPGTLETQSMETDGRGAVYMFFGAVSPTGQGECVLSARTHTRARATRPSLPVIGATLTTDAVWKLDPSWEHEQWCGGEGRCAALVCGCG